MTQRYKALRTVTEHLRLKATCILAASCVLLAWQNVRAAEVGRVTVGDIGITVSDLDEVLAFYCDVLTFDKVSESEWVGEPIERATGVFGARVRSARLRLGDESIELTEFLTPRGKPIPPDSRSYDRWFQHIAIVTPDIERAYQHLRQHKVQHVSNQPQRLPDWNPNAGGIRAFYFTDPDGHVLEIIQFPSGKGNTKWQINDSDRLFFGIDHTAIVVKNTEESVQFYQSVFGLRVAGNSENYGSEQEHLNAVFGARLRITGLVGDGGPGLELLEYLAPPGGRDYPDDARANDLIHWQTTFRVQSIGDVFSGLRSANRPMLTGGIVEIPANDQRSATGLVTRDIDGHAIRVVEAQAGANATSAHAGNR